jgi:hypothetical protein
MENLFFYISIFCALISIIWLLIIIISVSKDRKVRKEFEKRCPGHTRMLSCIDCDDGIFEGNVCVGCKLAEEVGLEEKKNV